MTADDSNNLFLEALGTPNLIGVVLPWYSPAGICFKPESAYRSLSSSIAFWTNLMAEALSSGDSRKQICQLIACNVGTHV